ncbi:hypothetical protein TNCV_1156911 [Trichonephila clavipes]|nr:hypothetical protein TNCV_1156911 [Trichonephila clavipes]
MINCGRSRNRNPVVRIKRDKWFGKDSCYDFRSRPIEVCTSSGLINISLSDQRIIGSGFEYVGDFRVRLRELLRKNLNNTESNGDGR